MYAITATPAATPTGHPEGRQVGGRFRVGEVRSDAQFELLLAPDVGIGVLQPRVGEVFAQLANRLAALPAREFIFELLAVGSGQGGRIDQDHLHRNRMQPMAMALDSIEQRQKRPPRIADNSRGIE
jgi:hypothetical protein